MSYLILYVPITLVIMVVLETCRRSDPVEIAKRALANFGVLTTALVLGGMLVYLVNRYL